MDSRRRSFLMALTLGAARTAGSASGEGVDSIRALEVLHWWTSAGERLALDTLLQSVNAHALRWRDAAIPGGQSAAATTVLRSRLLSRDPPDMAHLSARTVHEMADKGLLLDLAAGPLRSHWPERLIPWIREALEQNGRSVAVPMGIHRTNTLLYNLRLWHAHGLPEPRTWSDVGGAAKTLSQQGVMPFVWSDDGGFLLGVFEGLLLSSLGSARFQALSDHQGWDDHGVLGALDHLRQLRSFSTRLIGRTPSWSRAGREFLFDRAGLWIGGDWARGELNAWGMRAGTDYACTTLPGTAGQYLYQIDALAAFDKGKSVAPSQRALAELLARPDLQRAYNRAKGSVPVLADMTVTGLDLAESATWLDLHQPTVEKIPGLSHRLGMAGLRTETLASLLGDWMRQPDRPAQAVWQQVMRLNRERPT